MEIGATSSILLSLFPCNRFYWPNYQGLAIVTRPAIFPGQKIWSDKVGSSKIEIRLDTKNQLLISEIDSREKKSKFRVRFSGHFSTTFCQPTSETKIRKSRFVLKLYTILSSFQKCFEKSVSKMVGKSGDFFSKTDI